MIEFEVEIDSFVALRSVACDWALSERVEDVKNILNAPSVDVVGSDSKLACLLALTNEGWSIEDRVLEPYKIGGAMEVQQSSIPRPTEYLKALLDVERFFKKVKSPLRDDGGGLFFFGKGACSGLNLKSIPRKFIHSNRVGMDPMVKP